MVVPMLASSTKRMSPERPLPPRFGTSRPRPARPQEGALGAFMAQKAAGM